MTFKQKVKTFGNNTKKIKNLVTKFCVKLDSGQYSHNIAHVVGFDKETYYLKIYIVLKRKLNNNRIINVTLLGLWR